MTESEGSAGHPPALLLRANGKLELLSEGGMLPSASSPGPLRVALFELRAGDLQ
jgi:hypothetical protein